MINQYIIIGIVAAVLFTGWRYGEMRYTAGADAMTAAFAQAHAAAAEKEKQDVKEVIKWKERTKIVYRDRIKKIKVAEDPTGCLDISLSDIGLSGMLRTGDNQTIDGSDSTN